MATPHLEAAPGDFAPTVLLPGDPLRARFIAQTYFKNPRQVNGVRNMLGYTGTYRGHPVSVLGSGMGIPSLSIYARELIVDYQVKNLIRVGSCGALSPDLQVHDLVLALGASTDSQVNRSRFRGLDFAAIADFQLLEAHAQAARHLGHPFTPGNIFSADLFYHPDPTLLEALQKMGILAIEMEAAGLYGLCAEYRARALAICTVSDHILTGESASSQEREQSFTAMMEIALEALPGLPTDS